MSLWLTVGASLVPTEVDLARPVSAFFDQGLVKLSSCAGVDVGPAELAVVLQTCDISTEKGSKLSPAACALALVTQLIVQDVGLHLHPFVDVSVLKLDKSCADGSNVTLLIGEGHSSGPLWVLELRVRVYSCVANSSIETIHYHSQLNRSQGTRDTPHKDGLAGIKRLRSVHNKITVAQVPRADLNRLVFDGGAGDAQVELPILLHTGFNQSLHRALLLEQQECVSLGWKVGLALCFVWPVDDQVTEATETGCYLIFVDIRGQTSHKHFTGEALDAFPVLVRVAVGRAEHTRDTLVAVAVIEEVVVDGEQRGATWWRKRR